MSEMSKKCREAMLAKAKRLGGEKDQKTDSSNWTPAKPLNTEYKTGLQPLGERMARKSGGRVEGEKAVVDAYVNRDVKSANAKAEGKPHEGGYKKGGWIKGAIKKPGALHKALGVKEGDKIPEKKLEKAEHSKNKLTAKRARLAETLKGMAKDREGRATGGKVKGKTNISINILAGQKPPMPGADAATMPVAPPPPMTPPPAAPIPPAAPPAMAMPPAMMQGSPMPMGRKAGGRVYRSYKDMDAGACSGDGRLEKTEIQKKKRA